MLVGKLTPLKNISNGQEVFLFHSKNGFFSTQREETSINIRATVLRQYPDNTGTLCGFKYIEDNSPVLRERRGVRDFPNIWGYLKGADDFAGQYPYYVNIADCVDCQLISKEVFSPSNKCYFCRNSLIHQKDIVCDNCLTINILKSHPK